MRFGDPRVQALAGCLAVWEMTVSGITNKSLRAWMTGMPGTPCTMNQASYDLARLRRNGLIQLVEHTNTYRLTPDGLTLGDDRDMCETGHGWMLMCANRWPELRLITSVVGGQAVERVGFVLFGGQHCRVVMPGRARPISSATTTMSVLPRELVANVCLRT